MKHYKLFNFIDQYRSDRPFISHQNKFEQVDDLNKQYINTIMNFNQYQNTKTNDKSEKYSNIIEKINNQNNNLINDINSLQDKYNLNFDQSYKIYSIIKNKIINSVLG